jgi:hypothetical protein
MLKDHRIDDGFIALMNELVWQVDGSNTFFEFDPDDVSVFGRWAFEHGLRPAILDIPHGYAVLFRNNDLARLRDMGVRLSPGMQPRLTPMPEITIASETGISPIRQERCWSPAATSYQPTARFIFGSMIPASFTGPSFVSWAAVDSE